MIPIPKNRIGEAIVNKYLNNGEKWESDYVLKTAEYSRISKYTGLNFIQIDNLPYSDYLQYNRDSWIDSFNKTEEGREFLKTLWRLKQTKADVQAIRQFNKERRT